ncbi:MAG: Zn-ribbon domain-containing OB-fold protein [Elusimicrobia bacterium]|nr:Zn-ribbon domain-containing OB-fold protein [Elusimicrobiota bacterium]
MQPQRYWREIPQRYRLEAGLCRKCGKVFMPPRGVCDSCRSTDFEMVRLSDKGRIHTFTVIRIPPSGFGEQVPYVLAVVELDDGVRPLPMVSGGGTPAPETPGAVRLTMQVADCEPEDVRIGDPVRLEFRKINEVGKSGVICYGYKAVPA